MVIGTTTSTYNKLHNNLQKSTNNLNASIEQLSSGKKINKASDSPAAMAVLSALQVQSRAFTQQISTGQSEVSMLQTADGALNSNSEALQRMSELSLQAANGTLTDGDRAGIQQEIDQLSMQVDKTANNTRFNDKKLLDGSLSVNLSTGQDFSINAATSAGLGIGKISVATQQDAIAATDSIKSAINTNSSLRANIGANINAVTSQIATNESSLTNALSAQSAIEDVDVASEIINMNKEALQSKFAIKAFNMQNITASKVLDLLG